ncbi:amidase family protein, partial [Sphingomonas bacterium]|uniref:amidase family protein n=1 Tax=Sphingomonas bacterium TaxID=1895847 RepID=UPI0020C6A905
VLRRAFGTDPAITAAAAAAMASLAAAGAIIVDPVELPDGILPLDGGNIVDAEFATAFDAYLRDGFMPGTAPASLRAILASGGFLPDHRAVLEARVAFRDSGARAAILARHAALRDRLDACASRAAIDLFLHPTSVVTPGSLDNPKGGWAPELAARSGWPALSVPAGRSDDGVPIGVELLARAGGEALLFRAGLAIEHGRGPRALPDLSLPGLHNG